MAIWSNIFFTVSFGMNDHRKVAFVCHIFPWITQTFTYNEVEALKENGIPLVVMAFKKPSPDVYGKLTAGMLASLKHTVYIPFPLSYRGLLLQLQGFLRRPFRYIGLFWQVLNGKFANFSNFNLRLHSIVDFMRGICIGMLLKDSGFRHIHAEFGDHASTSAWVAHKYADVPFSFRSHATFNPQLIQNKVSDADFVLCVSEFEKRQLASWGKSSRSNRIFVEYLGVDIEHWQPDTKVSCVDGDELILSVGTLIELKGHEYLIKACRFLKERSVKFRLIIVGEGSEYGRLMRLREELDLRLEVDFRSYCDINEVRKLMHQASVFCLPSVVTSCGDSDGIPLVLMEAMAVGKACISTKVAGIPELIVDGANGLLVEPRDPEALAKAIETVLIDRRLREELGRSARSQIVQKFNLKKNASRSAVYFRDNVI